MKVVVTGASGLIGSALVPHLREQGHEVLSLVRRTPASRHQARWDPDEGRIDVAALQGTDAVVHLAGAGVGDHRWTASYKRTILQSRVDGTTLISRTIAELDPAPRVLVSASGIDYYPDTDTEVTERSGRGTAFLSDVVEAWEGATASAREAGIAVSYARSALVLARKGGVLERLRPLVNLGLAGPIGPGDQWWSWITLDDQVRALTRLLDGDLPGPVNLSSPDPVPQRELVRALARQAHRPAILPAPTFALRAAVGQFSETIVASHRVVPRRLLDAGFTFEHPTLADAVRWVSS
ncbi:TIGR01777 family oxidoreductase [Angustibacter luteus]|uniref:TIGR01777 family oxidoreductase n=1 Tax=Angustibacter luteus TaxID=658456 RepID=A0ABW1JCL1_9ACTN